MIENLKKNDITKVLSKYKGTEKLIQLLKEGYNETARELIFEISALKNFIFQINNEVYAYIESNHKVFKPQKLLKNFMDMPFLDTIYKIKNVVINNLNIIMKRSKQINESNEYISNDINANNSNRLIEEDKLDFSNVIVEENNFKKNDESKNKTFFDEDLDNNENVNENKNIDYNELEILKKKWIQTLMGKSDEENSNINQKIDY